MKTNPSMIKTMLTNMGAVEYEIKKGKSSEVIIFLQGIFLDRHIWMEYSPELTGGTHYYVDMPANGGS